MDLGKRPDCVRRPTPGARHVVPEVAAADCAPDAAVAGREGGVVMEWQPIETAPGGITLILVFQPAHGPWRSRIKEVHGYEVEHSHSWGNDYPTHWMPLPEPPSCT